MFFNVLNKALVVFLIIFHADAFADVRPMTYTIRMDYNSVTDQFENVNATGSASIRVITTGQWPINISVEKDGITGRPVYDILGSKQYGLHRYYSDFSFFLRYREENNAGLSFIVKGYLDESILKHTPTGIYNDVAIINNNCKLVQSTNHITWPLIIQAINGAGCNGRTLDYDSQSNSHFDGSSMTFGFDLFNEIKNHLSRPDYKAGEYVGSITYTGDSIEARVGGHPLESYTFNFVITKKKQLTSFNFPMGMNANFIVNRYGSQYVGTSELLFNVDGVFNSSDKLRFSFSSANSQGGKFNLKHSTADKFIPYDVNLIDLKVGRPIVFNTQNESKQISNSSENIFNGKFNFNFSVNTGSVNIGDYSDRLTILVSLDL